MRTTEAMRRMLDESGTSAYAAALAMGRTDSYVSGMLRRGNEPAPSLLADLAAVCGYRLVLEPKGNELRGGAIPIDGRMEQPAEQPS